jgi:hypothetical protein
MPHTLPYRATTASGERFDIAFPLHPKTVSAVRTAQMLSRLLAALDTEARVDPATSNGDMLQALTMALAIRAAMIPAARGTTDRLAHDLLATALEALEQAHHHVPPAGHA